MYMTKISLGLAAIILAAGFAGYSPAGGSAAAAGVQNSDQATDLSAATKKTTKTTVKSGGKTTTRSTTTVRRPAGTTVRRSTTVRSGGAVVRRNNVVVRRPYRAWAARPYYGTAIIGGVALGTVIAVSAAHAYPVAPGPNACWYWSNPAETHGYWDYCTPP
jgi:hypothetical protein